MSSNLSPSLLFAAILGAGVLGGATFALLRPAPTASTSTTSSDHPAPTADPGFGAGGDNALPPGHPPTDDTSSLPPGHPAMGGQAMGASGGMGAMPGMDQPDDEAASITWKVPTAWKTMPNPSAMRLATYRIPKASGATDEADMSVMRAGGSTDANITRWIGQFQGASTPKRETKSVHGVQVTTVEVSGTYSGGMGMGGGGEKSDWTLLGAIVEAPGTPYFFKLTGPTASVRAAHADFASLIGSIAPAK